MSESALRIGVVAEGKTDKWVIEAALAAIPGAARSVVTMIQPEESLAFGDSGSGMGPHGGGWRGVLSWCATTAQGPGVSGVLLNRDVLDATESWLLPVLRPAEAVSECERNPAKRLASGRPRLVEQGGKKKTAEYKAIMPQIVQGWPQIVHARTQAAQFQQDIEAALRHINGAGAG